MKEIIYVIFRSTRKKPSRISQSHTLYLGWDALTQIHVAGRKYFRATHVSEEMLILEHDEFLRQETWLWDEVLLEDGPVS